MLDQVVPKLLEGEFICEATSPSLFRALADEAFRSEVDSFLGKIKRRLTITPNSQAYYASWVRVGKEQRAGRQARDGLDQANDPAGYPVH